MRHALGPTLLGLVGCLQACDLAYDEAGLDGVDDVDVERQGVSGGTSATGFGNVGTLFTSTAANGPWVKCTATLVAPSVVLTAAHCLKEEQGIGGPIADRLNWHADDVAGPFRCRAQIRYQHDAAWATVTPDGDTLTVEFDAPQHGVAPGQAVVLYDEDRVIGGGWIRESVPVESRTLVEK